MGKSQKTKSTVKAEPWKPIRGQLTNAFQDAEGIYSRGAPGFFPGQTVADQSGFTQQAFANMANRATTGNPLMGQARGEVSKMLRGDYLDPNTNPGFQGALSAALRPITDAFSGEVMPGIDSTFSSAGRFGSGMQREAYNDAQAGLGRAIGDVSSNMAMSNYGMERGNMMSAIPMAGGLAANDYKDISMLGLAGQGMDDYNQRLIDAERERYDFNANKDMGWLQNYIGLLGGAPQAGQTSTTTMPAPNPLATVAGLGLQGLSMLGGMGGLGGVFRGAAALPSMPNMGFASPFARA